MAHGSRQRSFSLNTITAHTAPARRRRPYIEVPWRCSWLKLLCHVSSFKYLHVDNMMALCGGVASRTTGTTPTQLSDVHPHSPRCACWRAGQAPRLHLHTDPDCHSTAQLPAAAARLAPNCSNACFFLLRFTYQHPPMQQCIPTCMPLRLVICPAHPGVTV